ncbi:hypothetical protein [Streptomyces bambusae]|uniref:hypothetical protein n=1 Tax=Streptomyces bambusae TaxID=1550616 RepID=UPI001CA520B6|nr:hypothetical protein [Streptomyces bambusae]
MFTGTVVLVPRPGTIGVVVDIGLEVEGFVDAILLPEETEGWPTEGVVTQFEVWWTDRPHQIRLKPLDPNFLRKDWPEFLTRWRPGWPAEIGQPAGPGLADGLESLGAFDGLKE